jgi:hypothetical protein
MTTLRLRRSHSWDRHRHAHLRTKILKAVSLLRAVHEAGRRADGYLLKIDALQRVDITIQAGRLGASGTNLLASVVSAGAGTRNQVGCGWRPTVPIPMPLRQ